MEYRDFEDVLHELLLCWCREVDLDVSTKRYIPSDQVDKFLDDVGTFSHYLFSQSDQDAMDQSSGQVDTAMEKTLRKFKLIQGGKKDDDELIN